MMVGMSRATARVIFLSSVASAMLRNTGIITAARPEVEGMKKESGTSTAVSSHNRLRTERARFTTNPVMRSASPVWRMAPPNTNAPIINQITSEDNDSKS